MKSLLYKLKDFIFFVVKVFELNLSVNSVFSVANISYYFRHSSISEAIKPVQPV
jgi:hypothetical protein